MVALRPVSLSRATAGPGDAETDDLKKRNAIGTECQGMNSRELRNARRCWLYRGTKKREGRDFGIEKSCIGNKVRKNSNS